MPEPIEYQVVRNLQAALAGIRVSDGYHFTVGATAVKLDPNVDVERLIAPDGPRPFVLIEITEDAWQYEPAEQVRLGFPITIHWVSESDPAFDESFDQTYFRGCADIERAIAKDPGRGGLASDTRITGRSYDTLGTSQVWAIVKTRITLRRTYGQPDA
jgi:hypothetical protein